jgi:ribonucleoside-diphosphate reductase beta chain
VWDNFDRRQKAKVANDAPEVEAEGGLFADAGVAAE